MANAGDLSSVIVYNPGNQPVKIALYSLSGRLLFLFPSKQMEPFTFCDVQSVPLGKGVYVFSAESQYQKAVISIVKTH